MTRQTTRTHAAAPRPAKAASLALAAALTLACVPGASRADDGDALPPSDIADVAEMASLPVAQGPALDVGFAPGSGRLDDRAITAIDYFTYYGVIETPVEKLHIVSHADQAGDTPDLVARRNAAVAAYIESKGVPRRFLSFENAADPATDMSDGNPRIDLFTR